MFYIAESLDHSSGPNELRPDTALILERLTKLGCEVEVLKLDSGNLLESAEKIVVDGDRVLGRINPENNGSLPISEYMNFLRFLKHNGVRVSPDPEHIEKFGRKDAVLKLPERFRLKETFLYQTYSEFESGLRKTLSDGQTRVIKTMQGSQGKGVFKIGPCESFGFSWQHAFDHRSQSGDLTEFLNSFVGNFGEQVIDMPFLPEIERGEVRFYCIREELVRVVRKVPKQGGFSATIGSGAHYSYHDPKTVSESTMMTQADIISILEHVDVSEAPLLWTIDCIAHDGRMVVSEINCTCPGFRHDQATLDALIRPLQSFYGLP